MSGGSISKGECDPVAEKCTSDPNFAVICAFLAEFGQHPSIIGAQSNGKTDKKPPDIGRLQTMIENSDDKVDDELIGFHVKVCYTIRKLLKKIILDISTHGSPRILSEPA